MVLDDAVDDREACAGALELRGAVRMPNATPRAAQERRHADKEEGDKDHDDPSGRYLVTPLEMPELLLVVVGVEFAHVVSVSCPERVREFAPRRSGEVGRGPARPAPRRPVGRARSEAAVAHLI